MSGLRKFHPYIPRSQPQSGSASARLPPKDLFNSPSLQDHASVKDPDEVERGRLSKELRLEYVEKGLMASFNPETGAWEEYERGDISMDRIMTLYRNGELELPHCFHVSNTSRNSSFSKMVPVKLVKSDSNFIKGYVGYFTPETHDCVWVPIHKARGRVPQKPGLKSDYPDKSIGQNLSIEELEAEEERQLAEGIARSIEDQGGRKCHDDFSSSSGSSSSSSASFSQQDSIDPYNVDVSSTSSYFASGTHDYRSAAHSEGTVSSGAAPSTPSMSRRQFDNDGFMLMPKHISEMLGPTSHYTAEKAAERKLSDAVLVTTVLQDAKDGEYKERPQSHPAFNTTSEVNTPAALKQFLDDRSDTTTRALTMPHSNSRTHVAILLLNSNEGLSRSALRVLRARSFKCSSCQCYFSMEVYTAHLGNKVWGTVCRNTPDLEYVPDLKDVFTTVREVPVEQTNWWMIYPFSSALSSPVGQAWRRWNSRAGITHDAWVLISTAWRLCPGCGKIRTFDAHRHHMENGGLCSKLGDEDFGYPGKEDDNDSDEESN